MMFLGKSLLKSGDFNADSELCGCRWFVFSPGGCHLVWTEMCPLQIHVEALSSHPTTATKWLYLEMGFLGGI